MDSLFHIIDLETQPEQTISYSKNLFFSAYPELTAWCVRAGVHECACVWFLIVVLVMELQTFPWSVDCFLLTFILKLSKHLSAAL